MKKFLVLTMSVFGMFMLVSCGSSSNMHCETESFEDGYCGDKEVKACSDGHSAYYEIGDKRFNCKSAGDCSNTVAEVMAYCSKTTAIPKTAETTVTPKTAETTVTLNPMIRCAASSKNALTAQLLKCVSREAKHITKFTTTSTNSTSQITHPCRTL